jgi:TPR repeat protein
MLIKNLKSISCIALFSVLALTACTKNAPDYGTAKKAYKHENFQTSLHHYEGLAEFGMPEAYVELGKHYLWGKGVERDPERAMKYFRQAEEMGAGEYARRYIPRTEVKLASESLKGRTSFFNDEAALVVLNKGMERNNRAAIFELGYAYEKGMGVPVNGEKAYEYYIQSGNMGYGRGDYYAGRLLLKGELLPRNISKAVDLYKKAGKNGYPRAYEQLSEIYRNGEYVSPNPKLAQQYKMLSKK